MNNKGFTLVEILATILIISFIFVYALVNLNETLSLSNEKAYDIIKKNVLNAADTYITECSNKLIECNREYEWQEDENTLSTSFYVNNLITKGYLKLNDNILINPINNQELNNCLQINVTKNKITNMYDYSIDDNLCK